MYVKAHFKVHPATSLAFAAARGFGLVIACDSGRPVGAHLPFRLIEQDGKVPKLEFHVARANPLAAIADKGGTWMVAVQGHDAYVSPDWYASPEQVPTWLYEAVHLSGPVRVVPGDHTRGHTERLSGGGHADGKLARTIRAMLASMVVRQQASPTVKTQNHDDLVALKGLAEAGTISPVIDRTYPLRQTPAAIDHVATGHARGTVVITMEDRPLACVA